MRGDALFPGGNDYPAEEAGVVSIRVRDPNETKRVIEAIIACLDGDQHTWPWQEELMSGFKLQRLGLVMEPEPGNPQEVEGVLNPAAVRGPDGKLYLFPRLVAKGNYSRIGIARVRFNEAGDPAASSGSALHWSRKLITSGGPTAAAAARILVSRLSNRSSAT